MLNTKQVKQFEKTGIIRIKQFFKKKEIIRLKDNLIKKLEKKNSLDCYYENIDGMKSLRRIEKLSNNSKDFYEILNNDKLKKIFTKITKKKHYLFKDKLNFKYPKSEGFGHHIDGHWFWYRKNSKKEKGWTRYGNSFLNVVIPLENVFLKNGCLYLSSKKNTLDMLGNSWDKITNSLNKNKNILKSKFVYKSYPLTIGDLLIFDWKVSHYSKKNLSEKSRMIIYATFSDKKNQMTKYYADKQKSNSSSKQKVFF